MLSRCKTKQPLSLYKPVVPDYSPLMALGCANLSCSFHVFISADTSSRCLLPLPQMLDELRALALVRAGMQRGGP